MFRVKLRKTDRLFTQLVRATYNYTCQRCGRYYPPDGNLYNLGVSHYWSRRHEATRFDLDNATLLCSIPCHQRWGHGEDRDEYKTFMLDRLGKDGFDRLDVLAHTIKKRDDKLVEIELKARLKEL